MTRSTLHHLRLVVPGALFVVLLPTIRDPVFTIVDLRLDYRGLGVGVFALVLGAIYHILKLRECLSGFSWHPIREHITERLLEIVAATLSLSDAEVSWLRADRRLLDVFYYLVDNDASLTSRSIGVYFNGVLVTSIVDLQVVCLVGFVAQGVLAALSGDPRRVYWMLALGTVWTTAAVALVPLAISRQRALSDEQLDLIADQHRPEVIRLTQNSLTSFSETAH